MMIVKIQCPLNVQDGPWLMYNEPRTLMVYVPEDDITPEVRAIVKARGGKAYFKAEVKGLAVKIGAEMPAQLW